MKLKRKTIISVTLNNLIQELNLIGVTVGHNGRANTTSLGVELFNDRAQVDSKGAYFYFKDCYISTNRLDCLWLTAKHCKSVFLMFMKPHIPAQSESGKEK